MFTVLTNDLTPGAYYASCREAPTNPLAHDEVLAENVWQMTVQAIASVGSA